MSEETRLVLLGGGIAIVSSVVTTLLASLIGYWLEGRREKSKLRLEMIQTMGRMAALYSQSQELQGKEPLKDSAIDEVMSVANLNRFRSLEEMAAGLGMLQVGLEQSKAKRDNAKKEADVREVSKQSQPDAFSP